jgi:hypothetical protein
LASASRSSRLASSQRNYRDFAQQEGDLLFKLGNVEAMLAALGQFRLKTTGGDFIAGTERRSPSA